MTILIAAIVSGMIVLIGFYTVLMILRCFNDWKERTQSQKRAQWNVLLPLYLSGEWDFETTITAISSKDLPFFSDVVEHYFETIKGEEAERLIQLIRRIGLADYHVRRLQKGTPFNQLRSAFFLGLIHESKALPVLSKKLSHPDPLFRLATARSIARLDTSKEYLYALMMTLIPTRIGRDLIADVLLTYGKDIGKPLGWFLQKEGVNVETVFLVDILVSLRYLPILPFILDVLPRIQEESVLLSLIRAVGELGNMKHRPAILSFLEHPSPHIRQACVQTIGKIGDATLLPLLRTRILTDADDIVAISAGKEMAAFSLGEVFMHHLTQTDNERLKRIAAQILFEKEAFHREE